MAYGFDYFEKNTITPGNPLPGESLSGTRSASDPVGGVKDYAKRPSYGQTVVSKTPTDSTGAMSYIGEHLIYVAVFIFLTLVIYWTVGNKGTFYFLILVLSGQLVFNANEIASLFPKEG